MLHYQPNTLCTSYSFNKLIQHAKRWELNLSALKRDALTDELCHGVRKLSTNAHLMMYLAKYGEIHEAKLIRAFQHLPNQIWHENAISVIDYGCGQGIAGMVFADFIRQKFVSNDYVSEIKLFEPSASCLNKAIVYTKSFLPHSMIIPYSKAIEEIQTDDVQCRNKTILHIFSNIIDITDIKYESIARILSESTERNNVIVCVSPYYQENARGRRMDDFGNSLKGFYKYYTFERHTNEWAESYSCQIHIYVSLHY